MKISGFWDFRKFPTFRILVFENSFKNFYFRVKKWQISNYAQKKPIGIVRDTYPNPIQSNFQGKRSTLKIDDFSSFQNFRSRIWVPGDLLLRFLVGLEVEWAAERPSGAAPAASDESTLAQGRPQCCRIPTHASGRPGDRSGRPQVALRKNATFLHYLMLFNYSSP